MHVSSSSSNWNNHGTAGNDHEMFHTSTTPVVFNTMTTHFLWSIPYVIYNSDPRLLIWGKKRLMNFVLNVDCSFFAPFTECSEILADCSSFLTPWFPGPYSMVSVSLARRPKGTATDHKKGDGGGRENRKNKNLSKRKCSPKTFMQSETQRKNSCMNKDKSSNYGLRGSQDGGQTLHPLAKFFT